MRPQRIVLSRRKGFDLQAHSLALNGLPAVNCARPGKYGNMYTVGDGCVEIATNKKVIIKDNAHAVLLFKKRLDSRKNNPLQKVFFETLKKELRGSNLACWCKLGAPCHADILLKIANERVDK